jgi:DNA-directed RNA polymerase specialized sigma subunit
VPYEAEPRSREATFPEIREEMERVQLLKETVAELPERCQRMVQMLFYHDPPLPYSEVARRLGLAEGSIGFIRGKCLEKLRANLEKKGF